MGRTPHKKERKRLCRKASFPSETFPSFFALPTGGSCLYSAWPADPAWTGSLPRVFPCWNCSVLPVSRSSSCSALLCLAGTIVPQTKRKSEPDEKWVRHSHQRINTLKRGLSVNTEFPPWHAGKRQFQRIRTFLGVDFSVGLSLSFYPSYFRAQKPLVLECMDRSIS